MPEPWEHQPVQLVFPVISDVHIKRGGEQDVKKLNTALDQLNRQAPHQDAFAVVGDLTNYGTVKEYKRFFGLFHQKKQPRTQALIAMGNHEYYNGLSAGKAQNRFLEQSGLSSIYYHRVIKGYHFMILSPENGTKHGYYSIKQIDWLKERLKEATDSAPGKPIFVFLHHPLRDTVYGSEEWGLQKHAGGMYRTLQDYPQVVAFSGHSHYPLEHPRSIHQDHFTSVGTSSVSYMELEKGKVQGNLPVGFHEVSQGLLVEVYQDEVVIKRRSFQHDQWIGSPWVIPITQSANQFLYTLKRAENRLSFPAGAFLSMRKDKTTTNRLAVEFTQGEGCGAAHFYRVTAVEKRSQSVSRVLDVFSEFYKWPIPDSLVVSLSGLKPESEYEIQVTAVDAYGNESGKFLHIVGKTKAKYKVVMFLTSLLRRKKEPVSM